MGREVRHYPDDMLIDKFNLPGEWERQPQLFTYWAEEAVYAQTVRDQITQQLELLKAQLDSDIRINFAAYGFSAKPTEAAIKAGILQQETYAAKVAELSDATKHMNIMNAAKAGMEHKRRALTSLTELQIAGFYGANTAPPQAKVSSAKKSQAALGDELEAKQKRTLTK
jgi:hypothetical protein